MNRKHFDPTTVNELFSWLESHVDQKSELYRTAHAYLETERAMCERELHEGAEKPFLSVITRTQGKRPDMLTETLLSLTGQSNTDFELLIMGHNLSEEQNQIVSDIITDLPEWMRAKTRLIPVTGGTRTTPLNVGFEAARGKYISFLDDDDLALENWVEAFYQLYLEYPGRVLHMYTLFQDWETVGGSFPNTPRAAAAPELKYCCDFKLLEQLSLNKCPPCGLAFPSRAFQEYGIRFDESLTTTEDWDYLMRCVFLTGVATTETPAALYRNWLNAENSSTVHKKEEWVENHKRIVENFVRTPIVLPKGTLHGVIDQNLDMASQKLFDAALDQTELFYDDGTGFSQAHKWCRIQSFDAERYPYVYVSECESDVLIRSFRFDPMRYSGISLENLTICVIHSDGEQTEFSVADVQTNGYVLDQTIIFLKSDPQIILNFEEPILAKEIRIGCRLNEQLNDAMVEEAISLLISTGIKQRLKRSLPYRAVRKLYRLLKKIFKRK